MSPKPAPRPDALVRPADLTPRRAIISGFIAFHIAADHHHCDAAVARLAAVGEAYGRPVSATRRPVAVVAHVFAESAGGGHLPAGRSHLSRRIQDRNGSFRFPPTTASPGAIRSSDSGNGRTTTSGQIPAIRSGLTRRGTSRESTTRAGCLPTPSNSIGTGRSLRPFDSGPPKEPMKWEHARFFTYTVKPADLR